MDFGELVLSQKGNPKLSYDGYCYNRTSTVSTEFETKIKWQCDRRREFKCNITILTNFEGQILRKPTKNHCHQRNFEGINNLKRKSNIISRALTHLEEPPSKVLNEVLTEESSKFNDGNLKQSIRYFRRKIRPVESSEANSIVIEGPWTLTLDNKKFYFGKVVENECVSHIFTTADNLNYLSVRIFINCSVILVFN